MMYHKCMNNTENQQNEKQTLDSVDADDGLFTNEKEDDRTIAPEPAPEQVAVDSKHLNKAKLPLKIGIGGTIASVVIFAIMILSWNSLMPMTWDIFMFLLYTFLVSFSYSVPLMIAGGIYYSQAKHKPHKTDNNKYMPFLWAAIPAIPLAILLHKVILPAIFLSMASF